MDRLVYYSCRFWGVMRRSIIIKAFILPLAKEPPENLGWGEMKNMDIKRQLAAIITNLQQAKQLTQIKDCRKIKGSKIPYRIRLNQYRIGFFFENETIELVRVLGRKDIY